MNLETVSTVVVDGANVAAGGGCRPPTLERISAARVFGLVAIDGEGVLLVERKLIACVAG